MEIKISQAVEKMPEKKDETDDGTYGVIKRIGYNQALSEVSNLSISKDKVIGMVIFDRERLAEKICDKIYGKGNFKRWRNMISPSAKSAIDDAFGISDAILADLPNLLESGGI